MSRSPPGRMQTDLLSKKSLQQFWLVEQLLAMSGFHRPPYPLVHCSHLNASHKVQGDRVFDGRDMSWIVHDRLVVCCGERRGESVFDLFPQLLR